MFIIATPSLVVNAQRNPLWRWVVGAVACPARCSPGIARERFGKDKPTFLAALIFPALQSK